MLQLKACFMSIVGMLLTQTPFINLIQSMYSVKRQHLHTNSHLEFANWNVIYAILKADNQPPHACNCFLSCVNY
jgi:hypothetical protein